MTKEKIEDVATDILLKRKKSLSLILGIALGLFLVFIALIIYDLTQDEFGSSALFGAIATSSMSLSFWLLLKKIDKELKRREDK